MEEFPKGTSPSSLVGDVLKPCGGDVCEENVSATRRLAADILRQVANREVDRVGSLAAEEGELGFVRRDDDGDDGRAGLLLLELFL